MDEQQAKRSQAAFDQFMAALNNFTAASIQQAKMLEELGKGICDGDDGLIAAIDDLREDIADLSNEIKLLRAAKGSPVDVDLGKLINGIIAKRRRES
jgi:hypothetical protein